jgi:Origin recognition complex subunit 6 (ORC6)
MPLIRRLCHQFLVPPLIPHVYTGLCVVLGLADLDSSPDDDDDDEEEHDNTYHHAVTNLILALFFLVLSKMQIGPTSSASYLADCETACAVARGEEEEEEEEMEKNKGASTARLSGNPTKAPVDAWIKRISSEGWTTGQDWWSSVPEGVVDRVGMPSAAAAAAAEKEQLAGIHHHNHTDYDADDRELVITSKKRSRKPAAGDGGGASDPNDDDDDDDDGTLLPGLGTMMQESVYWLGDERQAHYRQWRAGVELRLGRT